MTRMGHWRGSIDAWPWNDSGLIFVLFVLDLRLLVTVRVKVGPRSTCIWQFLLAAVEGPLPRRTYEMTTLFHLGRSCTFMVRGRYRYFSEKSHFKLTLNRFCRKAHVLLYINLPGFFPHISHSTTST